MAWHKGSDSPHKGRFHVVSRPISLPQSPFPPIALGLFGLGTGHLIYGPQEPLGFPKRDASVAHPFGTFTAPPPLYLAALALSAHTRLIGFFHLGVGAWLIYLMFAVVLDLSLRYTLYL